MVNPKHAYDKQDNVLPREMLDRLLEAEQGTQWTLTGSHVSRDYRKATVARPPDSISDIRDTVIAKALEMYGGLRKARPFTVGRITAQMTVMKEGEFYKVHTDNGRGSNRRIFDRVVTFILYYGEQCEEGNLIIYPTKARLKGGSVMGIPVKGKEVTVEPVPNRLVVFPSYMRHEVRPVAGGVRRTLNGWICKDS